MKFYFDGELIRTSKTHRYTHAVVLPTKPGATNKWDAVGCRASLKSAQALLAQERRRIAKYNQKTADALRVVELEARPKQHRRKQNHERKTETDPRNRAEI